MLPPSGFPAGIAIGDRVNFEIRSTSDGKFQLASIERAPATPSASQARAGAVRASGEPAKPGAHDPSAHGAPATEPASPAVKP
jgi:hypothetical protein